MFTRKKGSIREPVTLEEPVPLVKLARSCVRFLELQSLGRSLPPSVTVGGFAGLGGRASAVSVLPACPMGVELGAQSESRG